MTSQENSWSLSLHSSLKQVLSQMLNQTQLVLTSLTPLHPSLVKQYSITSYETGFWPLILAGRENSDNWFLWWQDKKHQ